MNKNTYVNKNRQSNNASQSESINLVKNGNYTLVNGYQNFKISDELLEPIDDQLVLKQNLLKPIIEDLSIYKSFIDIGASNGYFSFLAKKLGFDDVTVLEHDHEYTQAIENLCRDYPKMHLSVLNNKFSEIDTNKSYDVVCMLALIHWIYSCTEVNGNFDAIFSKLSKITNNVLIIEWIDKSDDAINLFQHLSYNSESIQEEYTENNFVKSIEKYFNSFLILPHYKYKTRKIYVVFRDFTDNIKKGFFINQNNKSFYKIFSCNSLDDGTSEMYVTLDKKLILKKPVHFLENYVYEREVFWFERLKSEEFVPSLVFKDDINRLFITEYFGERISSRNKPKNWEYQLSEILEILNSKYGWENKDLKSTEILVSPNGKIGIVDFGWCTLNGDYSCGMGFSNSKEIPTEADIINTLSIKLK